MMVGWLAPQATPNGCWHPNVAIRKGKPEINYIFVFRMKCQLKEWWYVAVFKRRRPDLLDLSLLLLLDLRINKSKEKKNDLLGVFVVALCKMK